MSDGKMSWADLGAVNVDDVTAPIVIPKGHYSAMFTGKHEERTAKTGTLGAQFKIRLVEPMADVDMDEFNASTGFAKGGYDLVFWMSQNALFRFTDFVKGMGASGMSIPDALEFLANCEELFVVNIDHEESSKKPGVFYARADDPVPMSVFAS